MSKTVPTNKKIIVYQGSSSYIPVIACQIHFACHGKRRENDIAEKCQKPFAIAGQDMYGNWICSLAHHGHSELYRRAVLGIADIFDIDLSVIDIDKIFIDEVWPQGDFFKPVLLACFRWFHCGKIKQVLQRYISTAVVGG